MIMRTEPRSVLDVGVGFGMGGMVARQYGDVWHLRYAPDLWEVRVEGVECFPGYLQAHHRALYDEVHVGEALKLLPDLPVFDFVLCIDVLEHMERAAGSELLWWISRRGRQYLVSTPSHFFAQTAVHGNEAERHRSQWTAEELSEYGTVTQRGCLLMVQR